MDPIILKGTWIYNPLGPAGRNHGSLARARARGAGYHTDRPTTATSPRALLDLEDEVHGVGRAFKEGTSRHPAISILPVY